MSRRGACLAGSRFKEETQVSQKRSGSSIFSPVLCLLDFHLTLPGEICKPEGKEAWKLEFGGLHSRGFLRTKSKFTNTKCFLYL